MRIAARRGSLVGVDVASRIHLCLPPLRLSPPPPLLLRAAACHLAELPLPLLAKGFHHANERGDRVYHRLNGLGKDVVVSVFGLGPVRQLDHVVGILSDTGDMAEIHDCRVPDDEADETPAAA